MQTRILKFRIWDSYERNFLKSFGNEGKEFYIGGDFKLLRPLDYFIGKEYRYSIQQFTNTYDCNLKEIYEGDTVRCSENLDGDFSEEKFIVSFSVNNSKSKILSCFHLRSEDGKECLIDWKDLKICGTIFEF